MCEDEVCEAGVCEAGGDEVKVISNKAIGNIARLAYASSRYLDFSSSPPAPFSTLDLGSLFFFLALGCIALCMGRTEVDVFSRSSGRLLEMPWPNFKYSLQVMGRTETSFLGQYTLGVHTVSDHRLVYLRLIWRKRMKTEFEVGFLW